MIKILLIIPFLIFSLLLPDGISAAQEYKVKKGDTLHRIAQNYHVSVNQLKKVNSLRSSKLYPGDVIIIPAKSGSKKISTRSNRKKSTDNLQTEEDLTVHTVERGENLYRISLKYGLSVKELKNINKLSGNSIKVGQVLYVPSSGSQGKQQEMIEQPEKAISVSIPNEAAGAEDNLISEYNDRSIDMLANKVEYSSEETEEVQNWLSVIDIAMDYLGVPYRFGGSSLTGIDCSAFVQRVYRYFSIDLPRTAREQFKAGIRVAKKDLRIGDLIFFRTYARFPSHVGIYIGEGKMIHASSRDKKVTITNINEPYYVRRYIGAIRLSDNPAKIPQEGITSITSN